MMYMRARRGIEETNVARWLMASMLVLCLLVSACASLRIWRRIARTNTGAYTRWFPPGSYSVMCSRLPGDAQEEPRPCYPPTDVARYHADSHIVIRTNEVIYRTIHTNRLDPCDGPYPDMKRAWSLCTFDIDSPARVDIELAGEIASIVSNRTITSYRYVK